MSKKLLESDKLKMQTAENTKMTQTNLKLQKQSHSEHVLISMLP